MCQSSFFRYLTDEGSRAFLVSLRKAVQPILANNLLPHFTDHSVEHSDRVAQLVDNLVAPLASGPSRLNDKELVVLYSACYLHDIGMQYERAGDTVSIRQLGLAPDWNDLQAATRQDLLRKHHHEISAELVRSSVRATYPLVGIQLNDQWEPGCIASLCEAHATDTRSDRYSQLVQEGPQIRMELLSAILRLADILDECRRRALLHKARTLDLDAIAATHWWRNYYTKDVEFDSAQGAIVLWFEFPPDRYDEYQTVLPRLQVPLIRDEFARHQSTFAHYQFNWVVEERYDSRERSIAEPMPDSVMAEMLKELRSRQLAEDEERRQTSMASFKESRPLIQRQLDQLNGDKDSLPAGEYLKRLSTIACWMWDTGSKRNACILLDGEFDRSSAQLTPHDRVEIGTRLIQMAAELGWPELARNAADIVRQEAENPKTPDPNRYHCFAEIARWCIEMASDSEALEYIDRALLVAADNPDVVQLRAERDEVLLLTGNLDSLFKQEEAPGDNA